MTASNKAQADDFLKSLVRHNNTPGVQYDATMDNNILFEHNSGLAEFETNKQVTYETFFNACSVTKRLHRLQLGSLLKKAN